MIALPDNPAPSTPADPAPAPPTDPPLPTLTPLELQIALATLTDPATPPLAHAARLDIPPADFLQALAPDGPIQQWIQAALTAEALQQQIVEDRARTAALDILTQLARDPEIPPIERRRAAAAILRPRSSPGGSWGSQGPARSGEGHRGGERSERPRGVPDPETTRRWADELEEARRLGALRLADAAALRSRFNFSTRDDAAISVTKILTGAHPEDPEAAFSALALVTRDERPRIDQFVEACRPIHHAAGAAPIALEHIGHDWYALSLRPRGSAEPLNIRFRIFKALRADYFEVVDLRPADGPLPWADHIPPRPIPLPHASEDPRGNENPRGNGNPRARELVPLRVFSPRHASAAADDDRPP